MTLSPRETTFVLPFYLNLMENNATSFGEKVWDDVVVVGRTASVDDVLWLLRIGAWRQVVMGAWLSLRFGQREVGAAVLDAILESAGSLTSPPLAVAAVLVVGQDAVTALHQSKARHEEFSALILDAALERLDAHPAHEVSEQTRETLSGLLAFGERLRGALTEP